MIGERIKLLRMKKQITQETLANALHISPQAVSKWENGTATPDVSLLVPIADYFGVTVDLILRDAAEKKVIDQSFWEIKMGPADYPATMGTITNVSPYYFSSLMIETIFRNANGEMLDFRRDYLGDLPPGYTQHYAAITHRRKKPHTIEIKIIDFDIK